MGFLVAGEGRDGTEEMRRMRLFMEVPAIQEVAARRMFGGDSALTKYVALRLDRDLEDLEVQVTSGALNGALLGALRHWHASGARRPSEELLEEMFEALRRGFDLEGT